MGVLHSADDAPVPAPIASERGAGVGRKSQVAGPGSYVVACSALAGELVVNRENAELGTLEHFMVDAAEGRIAYGVLSRGGVMGLGARLFAVPWQALALDAERKCFVLDVAPERLRQAPGFDREHWPSMADPAFMRAVEEFFQRRPRESTRSLR
jgi:hypothetical protein